VAADVVLAVVVAGGMTQGGQTRKEAEPLILTIERCGSGVN